MFSKRKKKSFPTETFIPKPARIAAILQLCLVFTFVLYLASYPFLGQLYEHKSKTLLYRTVLGDSSLVTSFESLQTQQYRDQLQRNEELFQQLPEAERVEITSQYEKIRTRGEKSFLTKLGKSIHIFLFELPIFELAWIILSIVIPILLLLKIEGAALSACLLPVIALCYAATNFHYGHPIQQSTDTSLFPSEELIVRDYLKDPLPRDIIEQHKQLLRGWKIYLIQDWAGQQPSAQETIFNNQAEEGEFYFNVARLHALAKAPHQERNWKEKESPLVLFLYVIWNVVFALAAQKKASSKDCMSLQDP